MTHIYYPFATLFGNAIILQGNDTDAMRISVEKNNGFDGEMTVIARRNPTTGEIKLEIEGTPTLSEKDKDLCLRFISWNYDYMKDRAQKRAKGEKIVL